MERKSGDDQKVKKLRMELSICKLLTPPNLPKGEEKSPFGGFRGSLMVYNFQFVIISFSYLTFWSASKT
jgi:hypothetical protein